MGKVKGTICRALILLLVFSIAVNSTNVNNSKPKDGDKPNNICDVQDIIDECNSQLATCETDDSEKGYKCVCKEGERMMDDKCAVDNCEMKCGVVYGVRNDHVECEGRGFENVECKCKDPDLTFDEDSQSCKTDNCESKCGVVYGVQNDHVECDGKRFENVECRCKDPDLTFDDDSKSCKKCDCGLNSVKCSFEEEKKLCECKEGYGDREGICTGTCKTNADCKHGANCLVEDSVGFCFCRAGTSGDMCDIIDDCKTRKFRNCKGEKGQCLYDERTEGAKCVCSEKKVLNKGGGFCEDICDVQDIIDECNSQLATCETDDSGKGYKCVCKEGEKMMDDKCAADYCASNPCENGGTCINEEYSYKCRCVGRFGGNDCEMEVCDESETEMCGDVVCVYDTLRKKATCLCEEGKTFDRKSKTCEECDCGELGKCELVNGTKTCFCSRGFVDVGGKCQDLCSENPCKNGASCVVENVSYRCICKKPYTGTNCEADPCSENPCFNDGICFVHGDTFKCFCNSPFTGNKCEKDPCKKKPCKNGGTCFVERENFKCFCGSSFSGEMCETNTENMKIAVWVLSTVLILFIGANVLVFCRRNQSRLKEESKNNC